MAKPQPVVTGLPEGYKPGLEGVIAGLSQISEVNPDQDALTYRGYTAHELADKSSFTDTAYLLLFGRLPTETQLEEFREELYKERDVPEIIVDLYKKLPKTTDPMTALSMGVSILHTYEKDGEAVDEESNFAKSKRLIAKVPTLIAYYYRLANGKDVIAPDPKLRHGANFLYMIDGKAPAEEVAMAFDSTMILYMEHGYNASTFASLVTASTLSDIHSAIVSAIGTLKGSLHGGANEKAIKMLLKIGDESKAEAWIKEALAKKEKIMGFGHRVYKNQDSRAPIMKRLAEKTAARVGDKTLFTLADKVETTLMREKKLFPNVDYYAAVFYYLLGIAPEIYTPIFALARTVGWTAHVIQQHKANRLIRPKAIYTGAKGLRFTPIEKRV